jgi:hypothetical protein
LGSGCKYTEVWDLHRQKHETFSEKQTKSKKGLGAW